MKSTFVNIHTHRRTGKGIEAISVMAGRGEPLPVPPVSVGIHPWQVGELDEEGLGAALREVESAPVTAIGEMGLDFAPSVPGDHGLQKMMFAAQLRIAEERGLPVVLHCVRAFEPVMEILAGFRLRAAIFHGFHGSPEQARRAVRSGYCLSFGERSFASPKTVEAMREIPLEKMFLETDEAPVPIARIYERAAEILDVPVPSLVERLYENYRNIFNFELSIFD